MHRLCVDHRADRVFGLARDRRFNRLNVEHLFLRIVYFYTDRSKCGHLQVKNGVRGNIFLIATEIII